MSFPSSLPSINFKVPTLFSHLFLSSQILFLVTSSSQTHVSKLHLTFHLQIFFESPFFCSVPFKFNHSLLSSNIMAEAKTAEISVPRKWPDVKENPHASQRSKVWMEGKQVKKTDQKVPVIYYLSRNGQLEHPHFMVVPLSSSQGLYLKDVISRLSSLRGQGIANMYSWSSKRSYKNSFVWQDLSEDDFIYPCQGHEYVLKGSQLLESNSLSFRSFESTASSFSSSSSSMFSRETNSPGDEYLNAPPTQSCGSFEDLREYRVYGPKTVKELGAKAASVSTQTEDKARQRRTNIAVIAEPAEGNGEVGGLESLKGPMEVHDGSGKDETTEINARECGRTKASTVLMQLIRCGARIKDCEPIKSKDLA